MGLEQVNIESGSISSLKKVGMRDCSSLMSMQSTSHKDSSSSSLVLTGGLEFEE